MKKIFLILSAAIILGSCATTEKPGDIVEKEVSAKGEKSVRKLKYYTLTEYDEKGKTIRWICENRCDRTEYDVNGNETYCKKTDGGIVIREEWSEYDMAGNKTRFKASDGEEWWREYDGNGNEIHAKFSNGDEWWNEYDEKGNEIHRLCSNGEETWYEYNAMGKMFSCRHKLLGEGGQLEEHRDEYKYDERGNCIYSKEAVEGEYWSEYDSAGNLIHCKSNAGWEAWFEYDASGNEIHYKNMLNGEVQYEYWIEYDEKGNKKYMKEKSGKESLWEYDTAGNLVYEKWGAKESFYEYDFHPNGKIKAKREYTSNL